MNKKNSKQTSKIYQKPNEYRRITIGKQNNNKNRPSVQQSAQRNGCHRGRTIKIAFTDQIKARRAKYLHRVRIKRVGVELLKLVEQL